MINYIHSPRFTLEFEGPDFPTAQIPEILSQMVTKFTSQVDGKGITYQVTFRETEDLLANRFAAMVRTIKIVFKDAKGNSILRDDALEVGPIGYLTEGDYDKDTLTVTALYGQKKKEEPLPVSDVLPSEATEPVSETIN